MKATEFRIGNYYFDGVSISKVFVIDAGGINPFEGQFYKQYEENSATIPIDKEWLLKFGFELYNESDNDKYFTKNGFNIAILDEEYYFTGVTDGKKINHVHQLQNLYYTLTGHEIDE